MNKTDETLLKAFGDCKSWRNFAVSTSAKSGIHALVELVMECPERIVGDDYIVRNAVRRTIENKLAFLHELKPEPWLDSEKNHPMRGAAR